MTLKVATITLVVDDYDRAIGFYRDALGLRARFLCLFN